MPFLDTYLPLLTSALRILIVVSISGANLSCGARSPSGGARNDVQRAYLMTWMTASGCGPPCWNEVIPGGTTADQAMLLLNQYGASAVVIHEPPQFPQTGAIRWESADINLGGLARYDPQTTQRTITEITITGDYRVVLGDMISALGEPAYVFVDKTQESPADKVLYEVILVYLDTGLVVFGSYDTEPTIGSETVFQQISLVPPTKEGLAQAFNGAAWVTDLLPWEDGQPFSEYCRKLASCDDLIQR